MLATPMFSGESAAITVFLSPSCRCGRTRLGHNVEIVERVSGFGWLLGWMAGEVSE